MKRIPFLLAGLTLVLLVTGIRWPQPTRAASAASAVSAVQAAPFEDYFLAPLGDKPVNNWRVCRDLGVGPVPGLSSPRQRFRLCHSQGWEVVAYCLDPGLAAPAVGETCTRTSATTYSCGSGLQRLREYAVVETPSPPRRTVVVPPPSPLPTSTPVPPTQAPPTATSRPPAAPSPSPSSPSGPTQPSRPTQPGKPSKPGAPRHPAGGRGNFDLRSILAWVWVAPTATPFQPRVISPTPFRPHAPTQQAIPATPEAPTGFYGLDLTDPGHRVRILIFPPNPGVNAGMPILISFIPGQVCIYGDEHACVTLTWTGAGAPVTFITAHSGVGGEGQDFRNAIEGTGINSARLPLREVNANLRALEGAEVVIIQGKRRYEGFTLSAAARIPPGSLKAYLNQPVSNALWFAAQVEESLAKPAKGDLPLLVFETCGWKVPHEPWARGVTNTTASVYLGVIQKKP